MQKLLLLHGALGSAAHFTHLKELLANTFQIHTLNFESHGGREVVDTISIPGFAEEVLAYLNQNGIDKISIFGYSMGGYVALYLAKQQPDRIDKVFTLATKFDWTPQGAAKEAAMLDPIAINEKVPKYAAALEQLHGSNWKELMRKTADMMLGLGNNPTLKDADFTTIKTPVLLAVGDKDAMVTTTETEKVHRLIPNSGFLVLPDTIHPIDRVNQEELANRILEYFI
ncbi:MAG TPA: alpha/beta hydrolase [Flavobacterium sp.]|nr:alpha/beta hydrolase [Flavobacterium sp.]